MGAQGRSIRCAQDMPWMLQYQLDEVKQKPCGQPATAAKEKEVADIA